MLTIEDYIAAWHSGTHEGRLPGATHHGEAHGATCGDLAEIDLIIKDGLITAAHWSCFGCVMTKGICEVLCDHVVGLTPEQALMVQLPIDHILPTRAGCYMLPFQTLEEAINGNAGT